MGLIDQLGQFASRVNVRKVYAVVDVTQGACVRELSGGRNESGGDVGGECMVRACAVFQYCSAVDERFQCVGLSDVAEPNCGVLIQSEFDIACDDFRAKSSD